MYILHLALKTTKGLFVDITFVIWTSVYVRVNADAGQQAGGRVDEVYATLHPLYQT